MRHVSVIARKIKMFSKTENFKSNFTFIICSDMLTGYSVPRATVWRATKSFPPLKWLCEPKVSFTT